MAGMWSARALLSIGFCLVSTAVLAEPDVFGLGNGQHGQLRVQRVDTTINIATPLTAAAASGATALSVGSTTGFAAGELVLVLQVFAEGAAPASGTPAPLELSSTGAGRWEFARLQGVEGNSLRLTAPLVSGYSAPGSQVVRVPEYTSVHVQPDSSLLAPAWNGSSGGVLVFLATDAVLNQGIISADGAGFRGGGFSASNARLTGCTELDQSEATGGSRKGEGLFSAASGAPTHGHGALGNGAGGGNCRDAGGGGGGHGGAGGKGGYTASSDASRDVGGRGGGALRYEPLSRMMFGGGGGAGSGTGGGGAGTSGGAGGGIIYIRARDLQGSQGIVRANGRAAAAGNGGAGGGGAGGHITVRVERRVDCTGIEARGGAGGANTDSTPHGPGGGGGGGVVLLQGSTLTCSAVALPGVAGQAAAAGGGTHGATPTVDSQPEAQGEVTSVNESFNPPAVQWVLPTDGENTGPRPQLQGTTQEGATVSLFLDEAPIGTLVVPPGGTFLYQPTTDLAAGPHPVRAYAERLGVRGATSDPRSFTVGALQPLELDVGCGCGASPSGGSAVFVLAVLLAERLRRARDTR